MAVVPKAKRRNSEKRKEHSRDAARYRRSREAEVFLHLAKEIPLPYDLVKLLDKTSIIRLTITYLKLRTLLVEDVIGNDVSVSTGHLERKLDQLCHRALDGFLMIVASDGDILFVTDNITGFLGLTQVDMMCQNIYDLSHPCDHDEIREMIGVKSHPSDDSGQCRAVFIRMKSTITSKGRNVHIKSASYKVISCSSHLKSVQVSLPGGGGGGGGEETVSFVAIIGQSVTHPLNLEVPLDGQTFLSRHSLDMKFTECDESIHKLVGYRADEILGKSMYSFHHALDTETLDRTFKTLFCKGQASTGLYRFLAQRGGFVWVETHATVINNAVTDKPDHVMCLNYVVSEVECEDVVFDMVQLCPQMALPDDVGKMECDEAEKAVEDGLFISICPDTYKDDEQDSDQTCMQFVTEKILGQAVKDKDESDSIMMDQMDRYLLDPSPEMLSTDQSLYSINKLDQKSHDGRTSDMAGHESEADHGMLKNLSNSSLSSLLDKMEDGMEMRAPYISMDDDDLVFSCIDTSMAQSRVSEPQLSCLMNSDLMLPSVGREVSDPISSLFAMSLSENQSTRFSVPTAQISGGAKRLHARTDALDLLAVPRKVPRLDGASSVFGTDCSSVSRRTAALVNTVTMLTGPVTHVPTLMPSQGSVPKQNLLVDAKPDHQSKFPVTDLIAAPEKKLHADVEVGSGGQRMESSTTIYLVLNGQLTPVTITADQLGPSGGCGAVGGQSDAQMVDGSMLVNTAQDKNRSPRNDNVQLVVSSGGNLIVDLTNAGGCGTKTLSAGDFSVSQSEYANKVSNGSVFLESNGEHKMLVYGFGKSGVGHQLPTNQMITSLGRQDLTTSEASSTLFKQPSTAGNASPNVALPRLIVSAVRNALHVVPDQKLAERPVTWNGSTNQERYPLGHGAAREPYQHAVSSIHGAVDISGRGTGVGGGREGLPLHLKAQAGCILGQSVRPNFVKVPEAENVAKAPLKSDDVASDFSKSVLNGGSLQPLHLLQEGAAAAWYPSGAQMGHLQGEGNGCGGVRKQLFIPQRTASAAVVNTGGQQMPKPRSQMFVKSIRQPAPLAPRGISLPAAAQNSGGSFLLMRQDGDALEAVNNQNLASPCSGSVLAASGSSVLKNLLMKGVDVNYGYRLQSRSILDSQKQLAMG